MALADDGTVHGTRCLFIMFIVVWSGGIANDIRRHFALMAVPSVFSERGENGLVLGIRLNLGRRLDLSVASVMARSLLLWGAEGGLWRDRSKISPGEDKTAPVIICRS